MKVKDKKAQPETLATKRTFFTREDGKSYLLLLPYIILLLLLAGFYFFPFLDWTVHHSISSSF